MCEFFSFCGDGFGNYKYFDWEYRKSHLQDNCDSHTYILTEAKVPPKMQDRWSKYEYNPFTKNFIIDQGVEGHSYEDAEAWVSKLDFKTIIESLIVKKIINPLEVKKRKPTKKDIEDFEKWISIEKLMKNSLEDSIEDLVGESVWYSIKLSIWYILEDLVRLSVRYIEKDFMVALIKASIWTEAYIYCMSFFDIKYNYDLSPLWRLWDRGLVPSFDGTTWKLHSGKKTEVVYTKEI